MDGPRQTADRLKRIVRLATCWLVPAAALAFGADRWQEQRWQEHRALALALHEVGFELDRVSLLLETPEAPPTAIGFDLPRSPIPLGSLVKPFLAAAYGEAHGWTFPEIDCPGGERCWLPAGHGRLKIREALARSCNAYFNQLALAVPRPRLEDVARRYSIAAPPREALPAATWGLGPEWKIAPAAMLRAYGELARRRAEPGVAAIVAGLALAAESGTAAEVGMRTPGRALAKTGTAPCTHEAGGGDGFAVALYPADNPRYSILLRIHGRTGRAAARAAGAVLRAVIGPSDLRRPQSTP